ncbi:MAG: glycogen synthase [Candidatus Saccharicenans sp.]
MKRKDLRLAVVTPELAPYARSGELAEAVSGLVKALARQGTEINVFLPFYRKPELESLNKELITRELVVPVGRKKLKASVYRSEVGRYNLYLIDQPKYFHREHIYGSSQEYYPDNDERFIFFNRAVGEFLAESRMKIDVVHGHNWPSSLLPLFLKTVFQKKANLKKVASVLTVHNFSYQGEFPAESITLTGLDWHYMNSHQLAFRGKFNFLKTGLLFADVINTVSHTYRKEVLSQHPDLCSMLADKKKRLFSIRNGIDTEEWDPSADERLPANFSAENLEGKRICKKHLLKEFRLAIEEDTPLLALVGYLTRLKGLDLILNNLKKLMEQHSFGLLVIGQGEEIYEQAFSKLEQIYRGRLAVKLGHYQGTYHQVLAGADLLLMPSLEEPCGLAVMHAQRYGTVPLVRATGGLRETVIPFDGDSGRGNGFVFEDYSDQAFCQKFSEALKTYQNTKIWLNLVYNCFVNDNSWNKVINRYRALYQKAIKIKNGE